MDLNKSIPIARRSLPDNARGMNVKSDYRANTQGFASSSKNRGLQFGDDLCSVTAHFLTFCGFNNDFLPILLSNITNVKESFHAYELFVAEMCTILVQCNCTRIANTFSR